MTYDALPPGWLPTAEIVSTYCEINNIQGFKLPENHTGTNNHIKLAEIYVKAAQKGTLTEDVEGSATPLYLLTKFYTGKPQYAIPAHISSYLLSLNLLGEEELLAYLYFYSWNPQRVTPLIAVINEVVTTQDQLLSITQTQLDDFLDVQKWLHREGLTVPSKLAWVLGSATVEKRVELLTATNGKLDEILRVLALGADWNVLEEHFLGVGMLPLSFLENLYGGNN